MSIFDVFKGKADTPGRDVAVPEEPRVHVAQPASSANKRALRSVGLRQGMWVFVNDKGVGIVLDADVEGQVRVMLTDSEGFNLAEISSPYTNIRQARFQEIPPKRRPENASRAREWGYI